MTKHHTTDLIYDLNDRVAFDGNNCTVAEMIQEIHRRSWYSNHPMDSTRLKPLNQSEDYKYWKQWGAVEKICWLWKETKLLVAFALAMVIGGAVGNIWDRVHYGAVADFLHFHVSNYSFYVFNVADSAISLGVVLMLWDALLSPQKSTK